MKQIDMAIKNFIAVSLAAMTLLACKSNTNENMSTLNLTNEWDKTFPKSELVNHCKVTFHNRYGIELAADMYVPKNADVKLPAIAVSGPFGAVKEQSSGLYAQHMAERGFLTIAFDPSFTGESGGEPRRMASPDINTEDFLAAVDFLSNCEMVDPERIGIIGICGFGGMAVNAAALDPRIKATVASTMYDMSKVNVEGYFASEDTPAQRQEKRQALAAQRTKDYASGTYERAGGVVHFCGNDVGGKHSAGVAQRGLCVCVVGGDQAQDAEIGSSASYSWREGSQPLLQRVCLRAHDWKACGWRKCQRRQQGTAYHPWCLPCGSLR